MNRLVAYLGILFVIVFAVIWLAKTLDKQASPAVDDFNVICLGGVSYWYRQVGYKGMLAPKYNLDGTVELCEVD